MSNHRAPAIHLEIPGTFPKGGIPQILCKPPFKENEITHTQEPRDVTCGKCKRSIVKVYGRLALAQPKFREEAFHTP